MQDILGIVLLVISLFMTAVTGYWFYLATFKRDRFVRLMEEVTWPRISERAQYISAIVLFPLMLIGTVLMLIVVLTP
jgi:hypothetical protein